MGLSVGTRLGPYEILAALGAGGMGEVYRARDTRLDRTVAIKILTWSGSPERRKRFDVEARAISSLNDPNICTLYDVGHQDGTDYLVMEYLEGETLADRLQRGRLPLDQVLKIGMEIAGALDKAHAQGIVHRDLKPGNIMLTKSGAKLMDFGLAKPQAHAMSAVSGGGIEATMSKPLTAEGTIVGTFQYMAPEQLEGGQSDARSDIFGLGAVLYEMATGRRAFDGKSRISVVAAILEKEPESISTIAPMTPPALEDVVRTCLAKDPQERWQSAHDLKLQLAMISKSPAGTAAALPSGLPLWRRALPWVLAAVMTVALAGLSIVQLRKPPLPEPEVVRFAIDLGNLSFSGTGGGSRIALSPDGRKLVLLATRAGSNGTQLYLRSMDNVEILPLLGTEGALQPFFSPDSQWVGFSTEGKLKKVSLGGGLPMTLCAATASTGPVPATWADDGTILFLDGGKLYRIPDGGGTPEKIADSLTGGRFRWLASLPGSRGVLLVVMGINKFDIDVLSLETRKRERIIEGGSWPRYLSTGHILYAQYSAGGETAGFTGGLLVVPFDLKTLARTGSPTPVLQGVFAGTGGAGFYDVASNGMLVYNPGEPNAPPAGELAWIDRTGKTEVPIAAPPLAYTYPALSPDGAHVAVTVTGATIDVHVYDLRRGTLQRLTFEGRNLMPVFTPDGTRVIYSSLPSDGGPPNLWWRRSDGTGPAERLTTSDAGQFAGSVSPDGKLLAFWQAATPTAKPDVFVMPLDGDRKPRPFLATPFSENTPKFSPDGRWIAYTSNETGKSEVYVISYPNAAGKTPISVGGGSHPVWSRDGKLLYYVADDSIMVVEVNCRPVFRAGTPRVFRKDIRLGGGDVAAEGRLLVAHVPERADEERREVRVVENFATAVRRRLPAATP